MLHEQHHIQITGWSAAKTSLAIPLRTQTRTALDARRNAKFNLGSVLRLAAAGTFAARFVHHAPLPFAMRTRLRDAENPARRQHLAASAASAAGARLRTRLGARALAALALVELGDGNFLLATERGFFQRNFQIVTQVIAALRAGGIAAAAKHIFKNAAARAAKNFAENIERIVKVCAATAARARARVEGRVAVLVVSGALLRVAQNFVGVAQLLELFLGRFVARIFVRVKFHREAAVGFLESIR